MKLKFYFFLAFLALLLNACGEKEQKEKIKITDQSTAVQKEVVQEAASTTAEVDDMQNKGVGPIDNLNLNETIDEAMAVRGKELFNNMCTACHKMDQKSIGPALAGVTERRSPEWIMNMILRPEKMIKEDPIAKKLLIESNMAVMANQNMSEEESRAMLEYFRSYDQEN
ncbi:cytochrome c [Salinimicrobium sp. MT39]|uniref:Cytochrome c n=1 Tax=Salinimicrobium profundisediminis TaxID=2994553 RepID=A0A9X3CVC5_9FLAO|nr:cytochrome c [Salinimicrobium profundisediminis]MCX2837403.1 cytochrome c [Salinimicrobium profundisediminis]